VDVLVLKILVEPCWLTVEPILGSSMRLHTTFLPVAYHYAQGNYLNQIKFEIKTI
jgi:hypothetical protein